MHVTVLETLEWTGFSPGWTPYCPAWTNACPGWTESSPTLDPKILEIKIFLLPKIQMQINKYIYIVKMKKNIFCASIYV